MNKVLPGYAYNSDAVTRAAMALKDQPVGSRAHILEDGALVRIYTPSVATRTEIIRAEQEEAETIAPFVDPLTHRTYLTWTN